MPVPKKGTRFSKRLLEKRATRASQNAARGLLNMPPGECSALAALIATPNDYYTEIRNRIYHFAVESDETDLWCNVPPAVFPHSRSCGKSVWPLTPNKFSARKFLGLTQTCSQLRAEYRPIWLRNSRVRVTYTYLQDYIKTFYGCVHMWRDMPKLLQISWDHDVVPMLDLLPLLKLRAICSTTKIEFIPHVLTQDVGPWTDDVDCDYCKTDPDDEVERKEEDCAHLELRFEEYSEYVLDQEYAYLFELHELLTNDNSKWLQDIRDGSICRVKVDQFIYGYLDVLIYIDDESDMLQKPRFNENVTGVFRSYIRSRGLDKIPVDLVISGRNP